MLALVQRDVRPKIPQIRFSHMKIMNLLRRHAQFYRRRISVIHWANVKASYRANAEFHGKLAHLRQLVIILPHSNKFQLERNFISNELIDGASEHFVAASHAGYRFVNFFAVAVHREADNFDGIFLPELNDAVVYQRAVQNIDNAPDFGVRHGFFMLLALRFFIAMNTAQVAVRQKFNSGGKRRADMLPVFLDETNFAHLRIKTRHAVHKITPRKLSRS